MIMDDRAVEDPELDGRRLPMLLAGGGALLVLAAGLALWAQHGAEIFLQTAISAVMTCF
jgi:hypothetical protein